MKILHIAHYDRFPHYPRTFFNENGNGIEKWLEDIISRSNDEHYVLFFNHYENTVFVEKILNNGTASVYTYYDNTTYQRVELEEILKDIKKWLEMDIVHIHYMQDYVKDIPKILNDLEFTNIVATIHDESFLGGAYGIDASYEFDIRVDEFFYYTKSIIFINQITADKFLQIYEKNLISKYQIITNGVDLENDIHPLNDESMFKVLFLGTMHEVKGGKIIFDLASEKTAGVEYYLLGSIEKRPEYLTEMGSFNKTNIKERINSIMPDIIVIPSIAEETFSYTAAEATALGYPIVSFSVGALKEIEQNGRGFVVEQKDAIALRKTITRLRDIKKEEYQKWLTILSNVQQYETFSIDDMYNRYYTIYNSMGPFVDGVMIDWEYLFIRNNAYSKKKELQLLNTTNEVVQAKMWKENIPSFVKKSYRLYKKIFRNEK